MNELSPIGKIPPKRSELIEAEHDGVVAAAALTEVVGLVI